MKGISAHENIKRKQTSPNSCKTAASAVFPLFMYLMNSTVLAKHGGSKFTAESWETFFAFLFLCVNVFNYMLAGLKISLNLRASFGCLKDSLVSLSAMVMDIINPTLSNPVMLNSFSEPANKSAKTTL